MVAAVRQASSLAGFTGCGVCLETTNGLFFPQREPGEIGRCRVVVATEIYFNFGAPGLLLEPVEGGTDKLRDVGIFVGSIPKTTETVVIR